MNHSAKFKILLVIIVNTIFFSTYADESVPLELKLVNGIQWYGSIFKMEMGPRDVSSDVRYRLLYTKEESYYNLYIEKLIENEEGLIELHGTYFVDIFDALKMTNAHNKSINVDSIHWTSPTGATVGVNRTKFMIYLKDDRWLIKPGRSG